MHLTRIAIYILISVNFFLCLYILYEQRIILRAAGKILILVGVFILPLILFFLTMGTIIDHSKATSYCLFCHVMKPFGQSLQVNDEFSLPAVHFQNRLIPIQEACYTCHRDYSLFGPIKDKILGLKHIYNYYFRKSRNQPIKLKEPFKNTNCLICHDGARRFIENEIHRDDNLLANLRAGKASCLDDGCHDVVHLLEDKNE